MSINRIGMIQMDTKLKADWLAALRSGKYLQARQVLYDTADGYCCLGVLCKVAGGEFRDYVQPGPFGHQTIEHAAVRDGKMIGDPDDASLTDDFAGAIGIPKVSLTRLIELNDGFKDSEGNWQESKPFPEIADWIETHL